MSESIKTISALLVTGDSCIEDLVQTAAAKSEIYHFSIVDTITTTERALEVVSQLGNETLKAANVVLLSDEIDQPNDGAMVFRAGKVAGTLCASKDCDAGRTVLDDGTHVLPVPVVGLRFISTGSESNEFKSQVGGIVSMLSPFLPDARELLNDHKK